MSPPRPDCSSDWSQATRREIEKEESASLALAGYLAQGQAGGLPSHLHGIDPKLSAYSAGLTYSFGAGESPSDGYLDLILESLREHGVSIRVHGPGAPALMGGAEAVGKLSSDLMASVKKAKAHLVRRIMQLKSTWRPAPSGSVFPWPLDRPVYWELWPDSGRCLALDMPIEFDRWRYLYGDDRHTWHTASGYLYEDGQYDEPTGRFWDPHWRRKKRERDERSGINRIPD